MRSFKATYLAKKFGLAGKDELENAYVNMYALQLADIANKMELAIWEPDKAKKKELFDEIENTILPTNMKYFEDRLASNRTGFLVGDGLTLADLQLFSFLLTLSKKKEKTIENFPLIRSFDERIKAHPRIADWIAKTTKAKL